MKDLACTCDPGDAGPTGHMADCPVGARQILQRVFEVCDQLVVLGVPGAFLGPIIDWALEQERRLG
jgi:hypothetical protein